MIHPTNHFLSVDLEEIDETDMISKDEIQYANNIYTSDETTNFDSGML